MVRHHHWWEGSGGKGVVEGHPGRTDSRHVQQVPEYQIMISGSLMGAGTVQRQQCNNRVPEFSAGAAAG